MNFSDKKFLDTIPAVILAAGKGLRLSKYTEHTPKPLLKVDGIPILEYILINLIKVGIKHFLIVVGYKAETIETWVQEQFLAKMEERYRKYFSIKGEQGVRRKRGKKVNIDFVIQTKIDGTGGAALIAEDFIIKNSYNHFLLTYGDILVNKNIYKRLMDTFRNENHDHELFLVGNSTKDPSAGAAIYYNTNKVINLIEKPKKENPKTDLNNSGIYIFKKNIFDLLKKTRSSNRGEIELTTPVIEIIHNNGSVRLIKMTQNDFWSDVGTNEIYEKLNKYKNLRSEIFK
ncbi:MAG: sugar phosphate nucleotidyltransferase [Promethearchaeota archaeon]